MKKSERLNKELIYLSYRDQFHLKELEDEFNISERTALRDIANLEQIGLNFYVEKGRYGAYHLTKNKLWVPINFNLEEINAIFFALKALNKMTTTPFSNAYQQISHKLMKSLPKNRQDDIKTQQKVVSYHQQPTLHNVKYFKLLIKAASENIVLKMISEQYFKNAELVQVRDVFYQQGNWFSNLYNLDQKKWLITRCDQISFCEITDKTGKSKYELDALYSHFYQKCYSIPYSCELTKLGKEKASLNLYPTMKIEEKNDNIFLTGACNPSELDYLVDYIIGLGAEAKIIYPEKLKSRYIQKIKKILSKY